MTAAQRIQYNLDHVSPRGIDGGPHNIASRSNRGGSTPPPAPASLRKCQVQRIRRTVENGWHIRRAFREGRWILGAVGNCHTHQHEYEVILTSRSRAEFDVLVTEAWAYYISLLDSRRVDA